jgi:hypothetical protein
MPSFSWNIPVLGLQKIHCCFREILVFLSFIFWDFDMGLLPFDNVAVIGRMYLVTSLCRGAHYYFKYNILKPINIITY